MSEGIVVTCSWCHEPVDVRRRFCPVCGHDAKVARMACRCNACLRALAQAARDREALTGERKGKEER
jgi:predicted amidophosphoribosyltransferase